MSPPARVRPQPDKRPIDVLIRPFQRFARLQAASGILLLVCTAVALLWANSPWAPAYQGLWQTPVTVGVGSWMLSKPLLPWVNDGLMAVFFFVVGLEIKREVLAGELSTWKQAALPVAAALGGMVAPAGIYLMLTLGTTDHRGWGIPMATDIAFALGVLALLGDRIPNSLKVFLTALAIADDIGAVLVIALFYTADLSLTGLVVAGGILVLLLIVNALGVRNLPVYSVLGVALWLAFVQSGVHATVAGVLLAMTIPARSRLDPRPFVHRSRSLLDQFERTGGGESLLTASPERQEALHTLEEGFEQVQSPLQRLEHALHPGVAFGIMPVFALANAGVALGSSAQQGLGSPIALGTILGLAIGKPLGITLFAWVAARTGLAARSEELTWRLIHGAGWLGGIGFTMSLFIAGLAFDGPMLSLAKLGILTGSVIAGTVGYALLRTTTAASA